MNLLICWFCLFFFFFKQKTAYEMRISDWSSDVCSSDLVDKPADAFRRAAAGEFTPLPDGQSEFGFQTGAYWFHATVRNESQAETRWVLVQQYALSDFFDLYVRYPDGRTIHHASGDHRPFSARSIRDRHPNFLLDLPPGQPVELLVRVQSEKIGRASGRERVCQYV